MTDELTRQIACVEREIKMRERVYPRWVADKRMSQAKADDELATMRAVLVRLREGTDYAAGYAAGQRERDEARALLRESRKWLQIDAESPLEMDELSRRIDAALEGK